MVDCADSLGPRLERVLTAAETALTECSRPVGLVHLAPGAQVAWDNCCEDGGQLWVRVIEVYPSGRPFPARDSEQQCGLTTIAARVGLGAIRCAHVVGDNGIAPSAAQMTSDALGATADMSVLLGVLECEVEKPYKIDRWRPLGPQGGCAGGEWEFIIGLDWCGCGTN